MTFEIVNPILMNGHLIPNLLINVVYNENQVHFEKRGSLSVTKVLKVTYRKCKWMQLELQIHV